MDYPLDIKDYAAFIVWIGGKKKIKTELWLAFDWFLEKSVEWDYNRSISSL